MGKWELHGKSSRWHLSPPHAHWYHWYHVKLFFENFIFKVYYSHEIHPSTHRPTLYTWESKFAHTWVFWPSPIFLHLRSFIKSFPRPAQKHQTGIVEDERIVIRAQHLDQLINQADWQQVVTLFNNGGESISHSEEVFLDWAMAFCQHFFASCVNMPAKNHFFIMESVSFSCATFNWLLCNVLVELF